MNQIQIPSRPTVLVWRQGRQETRRTKLAEMSPQEIKKCLQDARIKPELRDSLEDELAIRATNASLAQARADHELQLEVVQALMAEGKARHVAENLTNTEVKLLAEARRLEVI